MSDLFDPATRRALDALVPPPLSTGFADRVVAGIAAEDAIAPLPPLVARRSRSRGWRRSGIILAGLAGFGVMSAAAAAGGVFGENVRQTVREAPVLGPIIATVAPEKPNRVKVKPKQAKAEVAKPVAAPSVAVTPRVETPPIGAMSPQDLRRELVAERIAERMEQRARLREANGLPPRPILPEDVRRRLVEMPPEDRKAAMERMRAAREARLEARLQAMTPEEREMVEQRIKARRAARHAWRARQLEAAPVGREVAAPEPLNKQDPSGAEQEAEFTTDD